MAVRDVRRAGRRVAILSVAIAPAAVLIAPVAGATAKLVGAVVRAQPATVAGPSITVTGLSLREHDLAPGATITRRSPDNACRAIAGASASPSSPALLTFVHAVAIPGDSPTTLQITTPWSSPAGGQSQSSGTFSSLLLTDRGHPQAALYGGPGGPDDFFHSTSAPSGLPASSVDGVYTFRITVVVHGRRLVADGAIDVAC